MVRKYKHKVTLFAAGFPGASEHETIDDVNVVRGGGRYSVYGKAKQYYLRNDDNFDLVIDEINVKPFLTPGFVKKKPVVGLMHQMPRSALMYELPFPISYFTYYFLVRRWLKKYTAVPMMTVSPSQERLFRDFGFERIFVVPEGLSVSPLERPPEKQSVPTVAFMGRLRGYKLPDHAVRAFSFIKRRIPDTKMFVIGDGPMRKKLDRMAVKDVTFLGKVDHQTKLDVVKKAHLLLVPSVEEGWGLVVTEANAMGTPVVAYDVPGLRDSVRHGETGMLSRSNTPEALAEAAIGLLQDRNELARLGAAALQYSRSFSWDKSASAVNDVIMGVAA